MMIRGMEGSRERWIKHYSSSHDILLVGEGDFSFSLSLAVAFGSATNIVATSLDSYDELINKYKDAKTNLTVLRGLGASLLHGVNATQMMTLPDLQWRKFHRIIYNFPHAGFYAREDDPELIMLHRCLVHGFLWNASSMLWLDGEIHISHKITPPFDRWRIEDLALECSLLCIEQNEFKIKDYPWYHNKRGSGADCDEPFPLGACRTFKFKLFPCVQMNLSTPQMFPTAVGLQQQSPISPFTTMFPTPAVGMQHSPMSPLSSYVADLSLSGQALYLHDINSECHRKSGGYLNHVEETFGSTSYDVVSGKFSTRTEFEVGQFSIFVSASFSPGNVTGFGGIVKCDQGKVVRIWKVSRDNISCPVEAHLQAIRHAMVRAFHIGWNKICIKTDVKDIAQRLNQRQSFDVVSMTIAEDIYLLCNLFQSCYFSSFDKNCFQASVRLASVSSTGVANFEWNSHFPPWIN